MNSKANWGKVADGARALNSYSNKGTILMRTVSIFLASGRRASKNTSEGVANTATTSDKNKNNRHSKMEDASGKINPKLLEALKKRTHFTKYVCFIY